MFGFGPGVGPQEWVTSAVSALDYFMSLLMGATFMQWFVMVGVGVTIVGQLYRIVMRRGGINDGIMVLGDDAGFVSQQMEAEREKIASRYNRGGRK